ncbi:hypothetical protein B0H11DRAFT_2012458 [Mycena galericulata]|nr:hypothetical protein B0H11DRAFT_2012458 [Mycena galericulata]
MPRRRNDENSAPATRRTARRGARLRKPTERARKTRDAKAAQEKALKDKKLKHARRRALKERQNESALTAERPDDTAQVRELRAALARARGERKAAEARARTHRSHRTQGPEDRSIARPRNMAKVTINDIRNELDLAGAENDQQWADIRGDVRRFMDAGMLDLKLGWKEQDNRRLGKVYNAIEDAYPELRRFRAQWATTFLVHESFGAQRTYKNCKGKDGSFRMRMRKTRMSQRERRLQDSDEGSMPSGTGPRAPSHSPDSSRSPSPNRDDGDDQASREGS